ncbi:MAG TPA: PKD domain-containing protein, partial [Myxococcaceae bacterium]|nr:PKD domain-containing protein [Myxococcaceae bacterium]
MALGEERVSLASSMVIEKIDQDREWVCTGEFMSLSARIGGEREPEAVYRWVWPIAGGGAELEPGPRLRWQAPETPGKYRVRFQICTDLGGRRVGVLAERELELDVRRCGEGEGQAHEPLRLELIQGLRGAFSFHVLYQGPESITAYEWDFGDGTRELTAGPLAEHAYPLQELEPDEPRSFTVKLTARLAGGGTLEATG